MKYDACEDCLLLFLDPNQIQEGLFPFKPHECTATRGISFPSPPSAGVSTRKGSGHSTDGTESGPYRPSRPFAFSRSAFKTFSGVIGTSRSEEHTSELQSR